MLERHSRPLADPPCPRIRRGTERRFRATAATGLLVCATGMLLARAAPAAARDLLGAWGQWAAFRDAAPARCYAIARPVAATRAGAADANLAIARFPPAARATVRARLSRAAAGPVTLRIGRAWIRLPTDGRDARALTPRADAEIVSAMRGGAVLTLDGQDAARRPFRDVYRLDGAGSAVDAALIGCIP